jgi:hypothetical protein
MKPHFFVNSDPSAFDSNCTTCGGKCRDSIHGRNDHERNEGAKIAAIRARRDPPRDPNCPGYAGPAPEGVDYSDWLAMNNID